MKINRIITVLLVFCLVSISVGCGLTQGKGSEVTEVTGENAVLDNSSENTVSVAVNESSTTVQSEITQIREAWERKEDMPTARYSF